MYSYIFKKLADYFFHWEISLLHGRLVSLCYVNGKKVNSNFLTWLSFTDVTFQEFCLISWFHGKNSAVLSIFILLKVFLPQYMPFSRYFNFSNILSNTQWHLWTISFKLFRLFSDSILKMIVFVKFETSLCLMCKLNNSCVTHIRMSWNVAVLQAFLLLYPNSLRIKKSASLLEMLKFASDALL